MPYRVVLIYLKIYDVQVITLNVRSLLHLPVDIRRQRKLGEFNPIPFESFLHLLKEL